MGNKRHLLTHSQVLGIIWLSIALLLIAAVIVFSSRKSSREATSDTLGLPFEEILTQKEDSVYYSRRHNKPNTHISNKKKHVDSTFYTSRPLSPKKQPLMVELNSADTLTLQLLHGIGPVYASRIVKYRERLGGFVCSEQLLEIYGFTPELLSHIKSNIRLDTSTIKPLHINSISLKQLARHPYVEYYQARDIVHLRQNGVRFLSPEDLRAIPSMADSTLQRLLPYLDFTDSIATK